MAASKNISFGYYGGKFSHLDWLLPLLPDCDAFVDVFGGSGAVVLNFTRCNSRTYNDIHGRLVNFFRVARDNGPELLEKIQLTLVSREEHQLAQKQHENSIEDARRWWVLMTQSFSGNPNAWSCCIASGRDGVADT